MECWERGVAVVDQALAASARSGMQYHDAELLTLRGELLHHSDFSNRADQGHDSFRRAVTVARAQGARWFELRVALSMHRWARRADAVDQAARSLADVVSSLSDEDCAELREARAILARH
jgi:adenylate cyclase